jgi:hypothetical protein
MILYDAQHREIKPGVRVAFNQSGNVVPGVVKEVRVNRGRKTWHPYTIFVQSELYKKPSKVKRAESMMVIDC